jgi:hypothetical protein
MPIPAKAPFFKKSRLVFITFNLFLLFAGQIYGYISTRRQLAANRRRKAESRMASLHSPVTASGHRTARTALLRTPQLPAMAAGVSATACRLSPSVATAYFIGRKMPEYHKKPYICGCF